MSLFSLLTRIRGKNPEDMRDSTLASPIVMAIRQRESEGLQTRLVELHGITGLTQPEALSAVARLERLGIVEIEPNHANTFESLVALTDDVRWRLERNSRGEAR
jgi:DNA-binding MarR family transcriptional regulator